MQTIRRTLQPWLRWLALYGLMLGGLCEGMQDLEPGGKARSHEPRHR